MDSTSSSSTATKSGDEIESASITSNKIKDKAKKKLVDSLQNMETEEKLSYLVDRVCSIEMLNLSTKKELEGLQRDKNRIPLFEKKISSLEKQLSKSEMIKSKLELLCRELNKANKDEKELNQQRLKAMQMTHNETVASLKQTLTELQQSVESKQDHSKRVEEVEKLSDHLNRLATDYDKRLNDLKAMYDERETDMNTIVKAKEDEVNSLRLQVEEMKKRVLEVFEENVVTKGQLLNSEEKVQTLMESEISLRKMLDGYSTKYSKLFKSMSQSNRSFDKFKEDMTRMNSNLIRVESEAKRYRAQVEESTKTIQTLLTEKSELEKDLSHKDRQLQQLQDLCRRLRSGSSDINPISSDLNPTNT